VKNEKPGPRSSAAPGGKENALPIEDYHSATGPSTILQAAAIELRVLSRLEFMLDADSPAGLAIAQVALFLLRLDRGIPPFPQSPPAFLDGLLESFRLKNSIYGRPLGTKRGQCWRATRHLKG
jgi:hypothetical protein